MTRDPGPRTLAAAASTLLAASPAAAQNTGVVSGTVVDSSGEVVPGATVTLVSEGKGDVRTQTSDEPASSRSARSRRGRTPSRWSWPDSAPSSAATTS